MFISFHQCGITGCIKFPLYGLSCCTCTWIGLPYAECVHTLIDYVALNLPELQRREEEPFRRFNLGSFIVITGLALPWSRTFVRFSQSASGFRSSPPHARCSCCSHSHGNDGAGFPKSCNGRHSGEFKGLFLQKLATDPCQRTTSGLKSVTIPL